MTLVKCSGNVKGGGSRKTTGVRGVPSYSSVGWGFSVFSKS